MRTPSEGQEVVQDSSKTHLCGNCGKSQNGTSILRCSWLKKSTIAPKSANQHTGRTMNLLVVQL